MCQFCINPNCSDSNSDSAFFCPQVKVANYPTVVNVNCNVTYPGTDVVGGYQIPDSQCG